MTVPSGTRPMTLLQRISSPSARQVGDPLNQAPRPFEQVVPRSNTGIVIEIPSHPRMLRTDRIIIRYRMVKLPNGQNINGSPTQVHPLPLAGSTVSPGIPINFVNNSPSTTQYTVPVKGGFPRDPGLNITYWVVDNTGKTWGFGLTWWLFWWAK